MWRVLILNMLQNSSTLVQLLISTSLLSLVPAINAHNIWSWQCENNLCRRVPYNENHLVFYSSIETCRLACGPAGGLWPLPTGQIKIHSNLVSFSKKSVSFLYPHNDLIRDNVLLFLDLISRENTSNCSSTNRLLVDFYFNATNDNFDWNTDESYSLNVNTLNDEIKVSISSETVWGARHAFETLTQLIEFSENDDETKCLVIPLAVNITDAPKFPHRGLLIDTSRNFLDVNVIKKHIDGLAASKMNILHWHVTDSQSFPLEIPTLPNMTKFGAYSQKEIYSKEDVEDIFAYARTRGVRVIIEIDAPSHAGNGWQWGPEAGLGNLAVCVNQAPYRDYCIQPPCGQLNPINENLYNVLQQLYSSIVEYMPKGEVFHMGGDEVFINCWNSTPEIVNYLKNTTLSTEVYLNLWAEFQRKALEAFDRASGRNDTPIVMWTSDLTNSSVITKYLSKERYVIQSWVEDNNPLPSELINLGYRLIISTKNLWYLDHGVWGSTKYHSWEQIYGNHLPNSKLVLGGEVCMWGERFDSTSVEARTWPRAAALGERLWSDPVKNPEDVTRRFGRHRQRLVKRGVDCEAVFPVWCYQNEESC